MLNELKQIRQLLETLSRQPDSDAAPATRHMNLQAGWNSIGRDDAPVTLVEFTDYECAYCRKFQAQTFAELRKKYIDTGKLRFINRDLPLDGHPGSLRAAQVARCAGEQGKFWEVRGILMASDAATLAGMKFAGALSLDRASLETCLETRKYEPDVRKDMLDAAALSVSATPTFLIGKTSPSRSLDGEIIVGALSLSVFEQKVAQLLRDDR